MLLREMVTVLVCLNAGVGIDCYCHCSDCSGDGYCFEGSNDYLDVLDVGVVILE